MQALRLSLYQQQAVFRNPISSEVVETYPLPPPSTVLGLLSTMLQRTFEPGDINISISGSYDALIRDYQWYKKSSIPKPYPIMVHILQDVNLLLHITAYQNTELLDKIKQAFTTPQRYLYLGRAEDVLKVENIKLVDIKTKNIEAKESISINKAIYLSGIFMQNISNRGIPYWLGTFLHQNEITVHSGKNPETKMIRNFDWVLYNYFENNSTINTEETSDFYHDGDDYVWWSLPNPLL